MLNQAVSCTSSIISAMRTGGLMKHDICHLLHISDLLANYKKISFYCVKADENCFSGLLLAGNFLNFHML